MEKVIFDTNKLRDKDPSLKEFFWNRSELEKFSKIAEVVISNMALWELSRQKNKTLESKRDSFLNNPFHWLRWINEEETRDFDHKAHIESLKNSESIKFTEIDISDTSVLLKIRDLSLENMPPFEDNSDKGFKDAYIYFTILEYLQKVSDKYVFVCTSDTRFKEALRKHQNIIVVDDFADYQSKSLSWLCDDYFLWRLSEYIIENELGNNPVYSGDIKGFWMNIDGKQILCVQLEWFEIVVLVEDREIIEHEFTSTYQGLIEWLIHSWKWWDTHDIAKELFNSWYLKWLSDNEIEWLIWAAIENPQISWTFHYTVEELYLKLYEAKKDVLPIELKKWIEALLFNS